MLKKILVLAVLGLLNQPVAASNSTDDQVIQELQERIKQLTNENEELKHRLALIEKNQSNDVIPEEKLPELPHQPQKEKRENNLNFGSGPMALADYNKIQETLQQGNFASAEKMLQAFINNRPDSDLIVNAKFWLAETFYHREKYAEAAPIYAEAYTDYLKKKKPGTRGDSKGPEILFKLAKTLQRLKKIPEAKATLQQLAKEFKNVPSALKQQIKDLKRELH